MKKALFILCILPFINVAHARIVTLYLTNTNQTNCVTIRGYETLKILSALRSGGLEGYVDIVRESRRVPLYPTIQVNTAVVMPAIVLTGPLEIHFYSTDYTPCCGPGLAWLTIEILPETYAVDKAVTVGPGPGGAVVSLETSTNLLDWTAISTGVYTNSPDAKFFRVSAERLPCQ